MESKTNDSPTTVKADQGIVECLLLSMNKFSRQSPLMMEQGCKALRLLAAKREYGNIVSKNYGDVVAIDALSFIMEEPRDDDEEDDEMVYENGKLVKKEKVKRPPKMRTKKIKQGKRESMIVQEALSLLVRLCYVGEKERLQISESGGISATCAVMKVAGANKIIHQKSLLLLGMLAATNSTCRDMLFEEEAGEVIATSMKRYASDWEISMYGCWTIACACFSHGSNQTTFQTAGCLSAARKAKIKFKSKSNENHASVRAWAAVAQDGIMGKKVNLTCGWWKQKYAENESIDYDSDAGLPGFRPKEFIREWIMESVTDSLEKWSDRYFVSVTLQKYVRGWIAKEWKGFGKKKKVRNVKKSKKGKKKKNGKMGKNDGKEEKRGRSREKGSSEKKGGSKSPSKKKGGKSKSSSKKKGDKSKSPSKRSKSPSKKKKGSPVDTKKDVGKKKSKSKSPSKKKKSKLSKGKKK
jgi:hypothetical protein